MKKSIFLVLLMIMSCTKKDTDKLKLDSALAVTGNVPNIYIDVNYSASGFLLSTLAFLDFPQGTPADISAYYARVKISGQATGYLSVTSAYISYNSSLNFSSLTTLTTITVTVELVKSGEVIASGTQSIRILPLADGSSAPENPMATVTLIRKYLNSYYIKASGLNFLTANLTRSVDFYAFYFPTDYQRYTLGWFPSFLGRVNIVGNTFLPTEGGFDFTLPNGTYEVSNIRVFITQTKYPWDYFTTRLRVPNVDYLIDWCLKNTVMFDIPLNGLDYTNLGRFSGYSDTSRINFSVGSMDQMINMQIYYLKGKEWLW